MALPTGTTLNDHGRVVVAFDYVILITTESRQSLLHFEPWPPASTSRFGGQRPQTRGQIHLVQNLNRVALALHYRRFLVI